MVISDINFSLDELRATEVDAENSFFSATQIAIEGGQIRIPENTVTVPAQTLTDMRVAATRESSGIIDLQRMLTALTNSTDEPAVANAEPEPSTSTPWSIALDSLRLVDNEIAFTDQTLATEFNTTAQIDVTVSDINNQPQSLMPLTATVELDSGGVLNLVAELTLLPQLDVAAELSVDNLVLDLVQPYLSDYTALDLQSGALESNVAIAINNAEPFSVTGDVEIANLELSDALMNESLITFSRFAIDNFAYSTAGNNAEISEVIFTDLNARVIVNEDGSTNIARSIKPATATTEVVEIDASTSNSPEAEASNTSLPSITVGRVRLENGSANFTDRSLPLVFNAIIQNLNGAVDGISNTTSQATEISLEGQVGEFGLLQLSSQLDPFNITEQSQFDLTFTNIDLPSTTPYVIKFAGREVDAGNVDLKLTYALNAGELVANNQMALSDMRLGDRVDHPGAMDLPLDLALALLKDSNGVIDLEIPVTGNVDDPEFNFGPAIRRAITNIFTNLVSAPFRLLGSLLGGSDDVSLDHIRFLPGRADIAAPEREILLQLGEALTQRPQLVLEIPLLQGTAADTLALQTLAVTERVESLLAANEATEATTATTASLTERRRSLLETLYTQAMLTPELAELQLAHTATPATADTNGSQATESAQLDIIAYNADLRDRLIAAEPIGQRELDALSQARMTSVMEFMITNGSIDSSRMRAAETEVGELDDEGWLNMTFGLSAE